MARAKTAPFYIMEMQTGLSSTAESITVDVGAYVDPADSQGIEILSVDYIWDGTDQLPINNGANDFRATAQLKDNTTGDLVDPTNLHLISSGHLTYDGGQNPAGISNVTDVYPDRLGIGKEGRVVVNDQLEFVVRSSTAVGSGRCTVRIMARVVTLTKKDYMTLALQTVSDN
tara:strand:+ start:1362 stop:1877 length:516 start_codon:yes stop_codon:yes gene_type:complete